MAQAREHEDVSPIRMMEKPWHKRSITEVACELDCSVERGLSSEQVARRQAVHGPNAITEHRGRGALRILLDQFADFMVLVLIAAAVVAGFIGEPQDTIAIVVIVVLNAALGFVQEYRAQRAITALKALAAPQARVRRDGDVSSVAAVDLVPGDVVLLDAGGSVPADLRVAEAVQLRIDEAALTGESHPVEKTNRALDDDGLGIGDRVNMTYKGTVVSHGRGVGIVVETGMRTELGRIAALLHEEEDVQTPLQRRLARLGRQLAMSVLVLCAIIFAVGLLRGEEPLLMLLTALSLAVAAIPEALPAVVTVSLALGARKMVRHHALIRRLPAVETLGSVTYICSDKTGTLTRNRMRVHAYFADAAFCDAPPPDALESEPWSTLLAALALSNDAVASGDDIEGDPTEAALLEAAARHGVKRAGLERHMPRRAELPFSSERARMSTLHADESGRITVFTKGAPERVLPLCVTQATSAGEVPMDVAAVAAAADRMAEQGLRVLAVAYRCVAAMPARIDAAVVETELTLLGLVGLLDPPRPEARDAVALCRSAGIHVVMITGDHPVTARAIASMLGILEPGGRVVTGAELARRSVEELREDVRDIRVYARVAPEQKIGIVKALQERGEFVAMTGDGVNDAPALQRADIGVAMGMSGTDVARQASDMVLLDDNFATTVQAVREGRRIYDNIRKFVRYVMTGNSAELWTLFVAPIVGLPVPLLPIHILWVNLLTDGLPGLALAAEPAEAGVMRRAPRPPRESMFARGVWQHVIWVGLLIGGATLGTQAWAYETGSAHWQSMTFTVLTLCQMGHVMAIRSERESLFMQGLWSNGLLLGAVVLTFVLQLATLYVPALNPVFKTVPLSGPELALCLAVSTVAFIAVEIEKSMVRRGRLYRGGCA